MGTEEQVQKGTKDTRMRHLSRLNQEVQNPAHRVVLLDRGLNECDTVATQTRQQLNLRI
jgi:hypothetical protein